MISDDVKEINKQVSNINTKVSNINTKNIERIIMQNDEDNNLNNNLMRKMKI